MLSALDLGWLAGLIEGEGCFQIPYSGKNRWRPRVQIIVTQKDPEILYRMRSILGFGYIVSDGHKKPYNYKRWSGVGPRAVGLCMTLYSLMSQKRRAEIRKVLAHWRSLPVQPTKTWARAGQPYTPPLRHGVRNTYARRGCRCAECRRANSAACNAWYQRRRAKHPKALAGPHSSVVPSRVTEG